MTVHTAETAPQVAAVPGLALQGVQDVLAFLEELAAALDGR